MMKMYKNIVYNHIGLGLFTLNSMKSSMKPFLNEEYNSCGCCRKLYEETDSSYISVLSTTNNLNKNVNIFVCDICALRLVKKGIDVSFDHRDPSQIRKDKIKSI